MVEAPLMCPICCDHGIEIVDGIRLAASNTQGDNIGRAVVYRCPQWHVFALFGQFAAREDRDLGAPTLRARL